MGSLLPDILNDQTSKGETEDGGDVNQTAVGTLASVGDLLVLQQFVAIDALELTGGETLLLLETLTQRTGQRTALDLPELSDMHTRGVHLQGSTHR